MIIIIGISVISVGGGFTQLFLQFCTPSPIRENDPSCRNGNRPEVDSTGWIARVFAEEPPSQWGEKVQEVYGYVWLLARY